MVSTSCDLSAHLNLRPHISFEKMIEAVRPELDKKNISIVWSIEGGE